MLHRAKPKNTEQKPVDYVDPKIAEEVKNSIFFSTSKRAKTASKTMKQGGVIRTTRTCHWKTNAVEVWRRFATTDNAQPQQPQPNTQQPQQNNNCDDTNLTANQNDEDIDEEEA